MERKTKAAILAATVLGTVAVLGIPLGQAQQNNPDAPGNPNIFLVVQQVQATLNNLVTAFGSFGSHVLTILADIETKLDHLQPTATPNTRLTPPFNIGDRQGIGCLVVNASSTPKHVTVVLVAETGVAFPPFLTNFLLNPGQSSGGSGFTDRGAFTCKFTVHDGTRNDIRGSLQYFPVGNSDSPTALPAE